MDVFGPDHDGVKPILSMLFHLIDLHAVGVSKSICLFGVKDAAMLRTYSDCEFLNAGILSFRKESSLLQTTMKK
jgi:hypothetical protein